MPNLGTVLVCLLLAAVVAVIVTVLVRDRRSGKHSCGAGCAHCEMAQYCHKRNA